MHFKKTLNTSIAIAALLLLIGVPLFLLSFKKPPAQPATVVAKVAITGQSLLAAVGAKEIGISQLPVGNYTTLGLYDRTPEMGLREFHDYVLLVEDQKTYQKWSVSLSDTPVGVGQFLFNFKVPRLGTTEFRAP